MSTSTHDRLKTLFKETHDAARAFDTELAAKTKELINTLRATTGLQLEAQLTPDDPATYCVDDLLRVDREGRARCAVCTTLHIRRSELTLPSDAYDNNNATFTLGVVLTLRRVDGAWLAGIADADMRTLGSLAEVEAFTALIMKEFETQTKRLAWEPALPMR